MTDTISSFDACPYHIHLQKEMERLAGSSDKASHESTDFKIAIANLTVNIDQLVKVVSNHETSIAALKDSESNRKGSTRVLMAELAILTGLVSSVVAGLIVKFV